MRFSERRRLRLSSRDALLAGVVATAATACSPYLHSPPARLVPLEAAKSLPKGDLALEGIRVAGSGCTVILTPLVMTILREASGFVRMLVLASLPLALSACSEDSSLPTLDPPDDVTAWAPTGARAVGIYPHDVIPEPDAFRTMHVGPNNSDNVWVAVAPALELAWVEETSFYIPEGPTYDDAGNLYFSPLFPQENVSLVSLDRATGRRNWAVEGNDDNAGSGAILVLNDPDEPGTQLVYHATYTEAMALRPDGTEVWRTSTGLTLPPVIPGGRSTTHSFGFNYHPPTDSLVVVMLGGEMLAFDRVTGDLLGEARVPGSPAVSQPPELPDFVVEASNALTDEVFGTTPSGLSFFSLIVDVIFGGGSVVTNYFAIDPNSGRIYVAATADDGADGTEDGVSELGALYAFELVEDGMGTLRFEAMDSVTFQGGTGSTPRVTEDGGRVFVADNVGNVIALDRDLEELWRFDLGEPAAASIAVSPDNHELYAVTQTDVFKLIDEGDAARLDWIATFGAFAGNPEIEVEFQALTPTIAANGIAISVGGGKPIAGREIMLEVGVGLLDRDTGELRSFALGREESIAITSVTPDGGVCTASSPVRRVSGKALYPSLAEEIIGGISCYAPIRNDLLARDATCAAGTRARNAATIAGSAPASADADLRQVRVLIAQSRSALERARDDGDLEAAAVARLDSTLAAVAQGLSRSSLGSAANELIRICTELAPSD